MDQITACGIGVGVGGGVFDGAGVTVGANVGAIAGGLVDFGLGVLLTGSGEAVTMTDLGAGVGSHEVRARITRTTNPKMITDVTFLRIDFFSINFPQVMLRSTGVLPVFLDYSLITISIIWKMTNVLNLVSIQIAKNPNFPLGFLSKWSMRRTGIEPELLELISF